MRPKRKSVDLGLKSVRSKGERVTGRPMSEAKDDDRLTLTLDWPEITLSRLARVSALWADLVQEISRNVAGRGGRRGLRWVISSITFGSPLAVTVGPKRLSSAVDPAMLSQISHSVIDGVAHVARFRDKPPSFSDATLGKLRKLAKEATVQRDRHIYVSNGRENRVAVGEQIVEAVNDFFGPTMESYGSVEGRLEAVFIHGARRFYVYDALTNRQVKCDFGDRVPLSEVLAAFEQRVAATGIIKSKAKTGEKLSVEVHQFRTFRPDTELPSTNRILELWGPE